jgi:hypothetical protein
MARERTSKAEGNYHRYFLMFDLCVLLFLAAKALELFAIDDTLRVGLGIGWLVLLLVLFSRKRRDEFANHCWAKAAETAFAMLLIAPFIVAFWTGLADGFADRPTSRDLSFLWEDVADIVFLTFFAKFEWTRFRGGRA